MNQILAASNPFATRFVRPGALEFRFTATNGSIGKNPSGNKCTKADRVGQLDGIGGQFNAELGESRLEEIVDDLHQHRIGLFVGHHGSGKSTLLHTLTPRLKSRFAVVHHLQFCQEYHPHLTARLRNRYRMVLKLRSQTKDLPSGGLLTLDGAEQLTRVELRLLCRRIRRRGLALLATCHAPISNLPILHRTVVTPQLIQDLTEELIAQAPDVVRHHIRQWLSDRPIASEVNLRDLFFDLYDVAHEAQMSTQC